MGLLDDFFGKSYKEYETETSPDVIAMFPLNKVDKDIVKNLTSNAKFNKSNMVAVNFLDLLKNIDAKTNETERKKLWESYKQSHPVAAAAQAPAAQPVVPVPAAAPAAVQERAPVPAPASDNGPSGMGGGGKRKGRKNKTTTKIVVAPAVKRRRRRKTIKVSAAAIDNAKPI
jgi:hypothetical protein